MTGNWAYVVGGTLAPDAPSYVERRADADLLSALRAGRFCYVLNSRQMGKSSLCVRTMDQLEDAGVSTAFVDLTKIGGRNVTPEQWYAGIAMEVGRSLELRNEFLAYWKDNGHLSPVQRLFGALREVALEKSSKPLVVFFDEIDATRSLSFSADEFFAAVRESYNRRVQDTVFERLTFCLLGVAVPNDLINNPTSTPFNIGERVYLQDFTVEEALALSSGIDRPNAQALLRRIHHWTNGQPYLTQGLCAAVARDATIQSPEGVDELVNRDLFDPKARETNINLADVANRALHAGDLEAEPEKFRADLLSAYETAWKGKPLADDEANRVAALMKLSGIMRSEGNRLKVRNRIYQRVFDRAWIRENMPGQELRRQKRSYWVGVFRTSIIGLLVVGLVGRLAYVESVMRQEAQTARIQAEHDLYVSKMNNVELFDKEGDSVQAAKLLDETKNSSFRGWEWAYWNRALHKYQEAYSIKGIDDDFRGQISDDGREILVESTGRYAVIDRRTKAVVLKGGTKDALSSYAMLGRRWVCIRSDLDGKATSITELSTGRVLYHAEVRSGGVSVSPMYGNLVWQTTSLDYSGGRTTSFMIDISTGHRLVQTQSDEAYSSLLASGSTTVAVGIWPTQRLDPSIEIYDIRSGLSVRRFKSNVDVGIFQGSISHDGRWLAIGGLRCVRLYSVDGQQAERKIELPIGVQIGKVSFSASDGFLFAQDTSQLLVVDWKTSKVIEVIPNASNHSVHDETDSLVVGGTTVRVIDIASFKPKFGARGQPKAQADVIETFKDSYRWLTHEFDTVFWSPTGICAMYWPNRCRRYSNPGLSPLGPEIKAPPGGWYSSYWSPGLWVRSIGDKGELGVSNGDTVKLLATGLPPFHVPVGMSIAYFLSLDGRELICQNLKKGSRNWVVSLPEPARWVSGPPDGSGLAVGYSGRAEIRDPGRGNLLGEIPFPNDMPFSNDVFFNDTYGISGAGKTVILRGNGPVPIFTVPFATSGGLAISPDSKRIAVSGKDGQSVIIYELGSMKRLLRVSFPWRAQSGLCFTSDGKNLLVGANYRGIVVLESDVHDPTLMVDLSDVKGGGR